MRLQNIEAYPTTRIDIGMIYGGNKANFRGLKRITLSDNDFEVKHSIGIWRVLKRQSKMSNHHSHDKDDTKSVGYLDANNNCFKLVKRISNAAA